MEVKNPTVDQMLVNTVAQAPANPNAKAPKDADRPDFDSMVHQKRSESAKGETKEAKAVRTDAEEPAKAEAPQERESVTDEQYAIAAAMMFQAQPDARYTAIQTETAPETVRTVDAEAAVELPETEAAADIPAAVADETAEAVEAPEIAVETAEAPVRAETPAETRNEASVAQERPEAAERTEEPEQKPASAVETDAPRAERTSETRRAAVREARPETEDDADTDTDAGQTLREAPLFEHVEAPVIKVAEAAKPIPLEAENGVEQLGEELGGVIVNSADANRIEVTLTPDNLGKLTVEVARGADGTLNVVLHTATERTANLLERGLDGLRQALAASAGREAQIEVRGGGEAQQQFLNPDGQNGQNRQQQQQDGRRHEQRNAQDFLQQLRLGLVDVDDSNE